MIYDAFTFFSELDVLEIRLNVLSDVVDRFVLVEARQTHQGEAKPLYYAENESRFARFSDRIEHIVIDRFPDECSTPVAREIFQRNAISRGLGNTQVGDTVLISDLDEIPRPESVAMAADRGGVNVFRQLLFSYFLNCVHLDDRGVPAAFWSGTVSYRHDDKVEIPQRYSELRYLRGGQTARLATRMRAVARRVRRFGELEGRARFLEDAGWHFTFQGGVDAIANKLKAYLHVEYNSEQYTSREAILAAIRERRDLFGRGGQYQIVPIDERFPAYLQDSAATRYRHLMAPET